MAGLICLAAVVDATTDSIVVRWPYAVWAIVLLGVVSLVVRSRST
jgi:hypothetical protein